MAKPTRENYISICREILADKRCDPEAIYRFAFAGRECLNAFETILCSAKYAYITSAGFCADLGGKAFFHSDKYNISRIMKCIGFNIEHLRIAAEVLDEHVLLIDSICEAKQLTRLSLEDGYFSTDSFQRIIQSCSNSIKILFTGMPIEWNINPMDLDLDTMVVECYVNENQRRKDFMKQNFYRTQHLILRFYECRDRDIAKFFGMKNVISTFVKKLEIEFSGIDTSLNSFDTFLQNIFITYPTLFNLKISVFNVKVIYGLSSLKAMQSFIELWNQQLSNFNIGSSNCNIKLFWEMKCIKKLDFERYFVRRCKELIHGFESTVIDEDLIEMKSQTMPEGRSFEIKIKNRDRKQP